MSFNFQMVSRVLMFGDALTPMLWLHHGTCWCGISLAALEVMAGAGYSVGASDGSAAPWCLLYVVVVGRSHLICDTAEEHSWQVESHAGCQCEHPLPRAIQILWFS